MSIYIHIIQGAPLNMHLPLQSYNSKLWEKSWKDRHSSLKVYYTQIQVQYAALVNLKSRRTKTERKHMDRGVDKHIRNISRCDRHKNTRGTTTITFVTKEVVSSDRTVIYGNMVCDVNRLSWKYEHTNK